ncbi:MAG: hypothetical protein Q4B60_04300 [Erysipelotrichaceae bacterium]|nr:hypothetical protein [Erysipelotrichaceae bacterium]
MIKQSKPIPVKILKEELEKACAKAGLPKPNYGNRKGQLVYIPSNKHRGN